LTELNKRGEKKTSYEELDSIKTLRKMMDFDRKPDNKDTANMPLHPLDKTDKQALSCKNKAILKSALEVPEGKAKNL
jgi:hypothetical protein